MEFATKCIRTRCNNSRDLPGDKQPIYLDNIYDRGSGFLYSRFRNPNVMALADTFRTLYDVEPSVPCFITNSGMTAIYLTIKKVYHDTHNKNILLADDCYSECREIFETETYMLPDYNTQYVNIDNDKELKTKLLSHKPGILIFSSLSNPLCIRHDVKHISELVHTISPSTQICVDNTSLSIYYCNPLKEGANIVVESLSKYYCGHGDVIAGMVIGNALVRIIAGYMGLHANPIDTWLVQRGISTLQLRMDRITSTATKVVHYLRSELGEDNVLYGGKGGLIVISLNANREMHKKLLAHLITFFPSGSFGQDNTIATISVPDDSYFLPDKWKENLRISIGLEDPNDLIFDLKKGINYIKKYGGYES